MDRLMVLLLATTLASGVRADNHVSDASMLMVVDCLLPNQIRRLGNMTYAAARQAIKTTAAQCEARGGEYVLFDRASRATTLKVWLPLAEQGDPEAQTYVGETYEKGLGAAPDYAAAADWYLRAAEQGYARAAINLANLFEQGLGLEKDPDMAAFWYRTASDFAGASASPADEPPTAKFTIVEPQLGQRGISITEAPPADAPLLVVGQIEADRDVAYVTLNGDPTTLVGGSLFRGEARPDEHDIITITAHFASGDRVTHRFSTRPGAAPALPSIGPLGEASNAPVGRQHALLIGNNEYATLPDLDSAVPDIEEIATLLESGYGYRITRLVDADRYQILTAMNELSRTLEPGDSVLIYYAGHGELDRANQRGHWLPVDAEADNTANWISNVAITDLLNIMPASRLLVIADSCYSGMMSINAVGAPSAATGRTRTAMTSGGVAPVLDGGGGDHSVFARELIAALEANVGSVSAREVYATIAPRVEQTARTLGFEQRPQYAPLRFAGHEGGDYVFTRQQQEP